MHARMHAKSAYLIDIVVYKVMNVLMPQSAQMYLLRNVYYIGNLEFAKLVPGEAHFYNLDGDEIEKQTTEIKWDAEAAEKGGFEHFMMKEIHEQPKAVQDTLNSVIKNGAIDLSSVEITEDEIKNFEQIYIVRLGTFQLSDIFYNTVGGVLGGLMYCAVMKAKKRL